MLNITNILPVNIGKISTLQQYVSKSILGGVPSDLEFWLSELEEFSIVLKGCIVTKIKITVLRKYVYAYTNNN